MKEFSPHLLVITAKIDRFTDAVGVVVAWLNIPLVLAVSYEVVARYAFNAPTIWSFDVTYMLYSAIDPWGVAGRSRPGRLHRRCGEPDRAPHGHEARDPRPGAQGRSAGDLVRRRDHDGPLSRF